jgi:Xaa-Pro aminopeptidase
MIGIPKSEFVERVRKVQDAMKKKKLDGLFVYGDEYRRENLRYLSNFWPIFERGACCVGLAGDPILVGAPEGAMYAKEMCPWKDIRNIKEFACVSVPEEIDYPSATFSSLREVLGDVLNGGRRLGVIGKWDMPGPIYDRLRGAIPDLEVIEADSILRGLRLVKSKNEIACLREAGRLACIGYEKLLAAAVSGNTELQAAGAAEGAARSEGAEGITFTVFGSGHRADTIIGRPTNKVIRDGEMVMAAFAVQYEGYIATTEYPFVAGKANDDQKRFLAALFEAANVQLKYLRAGSISGEMVRAVKAVFEARGLKQYDVYPPMHGIGLAEAESPYPDENATYAFRAGMCVNSDISLFGHPAGSNRIEEGFLILEDGWESLTPLIREAIAAGE